MVGTSFPITFPVAADLQRAEHCSPPPSTLCSMAGDDRGLPPRNPFPGEPRPRERDFSVGKYSRFSRGGERRQARLLSMRSKGTELVGRAHRIGRGCGETKTAASNHLHQYIHQPLAGHDSGASVGPVMREMEGAGTSGQFPGRDPKTPACRLRVSSERVFSSRDAPDSSGISPDGGCCWSGTSLQTLDAPNITGGFHEPSVAHSGICWSLPTDIL